MSFYILRLYSIYFPSKNILEIQINKRCSDTLFGFPLIILFLNARKEKK